MNELLGTKPTEVGARKMICQLKQGGTIRLIYAGCERV